MNKLMRRSIYNVSLLSDYLVHFPPSDSGRAKKISVETSDHHPDANTSWLVASNICHPELTIYAFLAAVYQVVKGHNQYLDFNNCSTPSNIPQYLFSICNSCFCSKNSFHPCMLVTGVPPYEL